MSGAFPCLRITADHLLPTGSFAEAQAQFLQPDQQAVAELSALLERYGAGIVAHFYMDVELQGVLSSCESPNIHISDSLLMADKAVQMASRGVENIIVLGVDFMSENVRAVLDASGYEAVNVYRVDPRAIGCSLAESAEGLNYGAWLTKASETKNSLHVVYINTSLQVKAAAHNLVPTITCTSSNVLQTILQAFSEVPDLTVWYGPDTYMGRNLAVMFEQIETLTDEEIAAIHPAHNQQSIRSLRQRFHYFRQGHCVVHHMFGDSVVETVRNEYPSAYHTAHLEVPGEMFELAIDAQRRGRGVVGSTSNILNFIAAQVEECLEMPATEPIVLPFVLGTEAGMITSIVRKVQEQLQQSSRTDIAVDIIFPVASEAVAQDETFGIVPGVAAGEGCSTAGGCATCPYMKMNSLDALVDTLEHVGAATDPAILKALEPKKYSSKVAGRRIADLGGEPILYMRHFQRTGVLPPELVAQITA